MRAAGLRCPCLPVPEPIEVQLSLHGEEKEREEKTVACCRAMSKDEEYDYLFKGGPGRTDRRSPASAH